MKTLLLALALIATSAMADIVIYPLAISHVSGSSPPCPGAYVGYATYSRTIANGWGWAPDTNNFTVFTATDTNSAGTKVQIVGKNLDSYCGQTTTSVANPPQSPKYRFTVYFTNNIPPNTNYPLVLHGFLP